MMTKRRKIFIRILSIFMICCLAFLCVGCMGNEPDDYDDSFDGGFSDDDLVYNLYGTKVLYRPDSYDFSKNSSLIGEENDYYGQYAWNILNELIETYAFGNSEKITAYASKTFSATELTYMYDCIRYKTDTVGTVKVRKNIDKDGNETTTNLSESEFYTIIGANFNQHWNMAFDYDLSGLSNLYSALLSDPIIYKTGTNIYNTFANATAIESAINGKYNNSTFKDQYISIYLGTNDQRDYANYSDYVKALQYAIYCYAIDVTPGTINVTIEDNVTLASTNCFSVTVTEKENGAPLTKTIDIALQDAIAKFKKAGSYVGIIDSQKANISKWILNNVIGYQINVLNDNFARYSSVTEVVTTDASGNTTTSYEFDIRNSSSSPFGRNYSTAVSNIVDASCKKVYIGKDGDTLVTIDQRYLASEIKEYAGETFIIGGDKNFPKYTEGQSAVSILPLEYQSVTIMFKENTKLSDLWIALKYDADLSGTTEGEYGTQYLDMIVELNYFNHSKQKLFKIGSQQTRVYDGPYEFGGDFPNDFPEDHGTLFFSDFDYNCTDSDIKSLVNSDGEISVGPFKTQIGSSILMTDVGLSGYNGLPLVSNNPRTIIGSSSIRNYFSILEPEEDDKLASNKTYLSGRLNENMFKGTDGCDYLEITYKVLKNKSDLNTNYKFYTGIAGIF